jgi:hypothetical protein
MLIVTLICHRQEQGKVWAVVIIIIMYTPLTAPTPTQLPQAHLVLELLLNQ